MASVNLNPVAADVLHGLHPAPRSSGQGGSMSHNRRIQRLTLAGFVSSLVVLVALAVLAFHEARTFAQTAGGLTHNREILRSVEHVRAALTGAETSHRGYLITGNPVYLEPYHEAATHIVSYQKLLEQLVAGDAQLSPLAIELGRNIGARQQTFRSVIDTYRAQGFGAAQAMITKNTGLRQTADVNRTINGINGLAQGQLHSLEQQQAAETRLRYSITAQAGVLLVVLSLIYLLVSRSVAAARQAEQLLNKLNVTLETRVIERTLQLEERTIELEQRSRQLEERSAQLEKTNQQLESFSYSVSHDLRAPLRAISGFSQIIERRHRNELSEEGRHFLDNIVLASAHMGRLIDDLLSYSRLGRKAVTLKPVALGQVLDNIRTTLQPRIAETGASLHIPDDLPAVTGDHTLLTQIFTNLIDNALTYRKPGVPAQVSLQWRDTGDGQVIISVADNGIGIATEHFEKIFSVFQRLHSQDEYPGTGIGLAVVQKSVSMQDGKIWLESAAGIGTTFHVRLPAAPQKTDTSLF